MLADDNCTVFAEENALGTQIEIDRKKEGTIRLKKDGVEKPFPYTQGEYVYFASAAQAFRTGHTLEPGGPDSVEEGSNRRVLEGVYTFHIGDRTKYKNIPILENVPGRTAI